MRSVTLSGRNPFRIYDFAISARFGYIRNPNSKIRNLAEHRCKESNPVERFWRPPALPGAHRYVGPACRTGPERCYRITIRGPARQAGPTHPIPRSSTLR
jgi:hypothetical protein